MSPSVPIQANPSTAARSAQGAASTPSGTRPQAADKLRRSTEEFEAVLVRQILTEAQKPLHSKPLFGDSQAAGIVRDMRTERMAESISRSGSVGLARYLENHLRRNLSQQDADTVRPSLQP